MTYGLRIINDDSEILIDSQLVNPTFVQKLEFNSTPTFTEAGDGQKHPGYVRRDYATTSFSATSGGNYIILWALPDTMSPGQPDKDVWYNFSTSSITMITTLTCSVYANSQGTPITYALPTAYIFAVNAAAVNAMSSTGPALRMYNSSGIKTFDSNFIQLVPYGITDSFNIPGADTTTTLYLPVPANPIYLLPKSAVLFAGDTGYGYSSEKVFDTSYRRRGSYIEARTMSTSYSDNNPPFGSYFASFFAGNVGNLSIIVADADFYQSSGAGTGGGANPTYTLSSNATNSQVNEGTILTVTLTTTLVANNTNVPWTVTGISAADLVGGSLTGNFVIQNNTATASFIIKNDALTEGVETFVLTLDSIGASISINVLDTSVTTAYSWATPASIDEGTTGSLVFNYTGAASKTITFSIVSGTATSADVTLNTTTYTTPASNSAGTISVSYSTAADSLTEGSETFAISATVDGTTYTSSSITINDTSLTPGYAITVVNGPWNESTTQSTTVTLNNVNGYTYFPTSDNANVTCQTTSFTVSSNNYTTTLYWNVGTVTTDTTVNLYLRRSRSNGTIDASTSVTVRNILPAGTYLSQYCSGVDLYYRYADGTYGGYYDQLYQANSTACGYVAPSWSLSASPTSVNEGSSFTVTLTTNQGGNFAYTITGVNSADIGGTSLTGTLANGGSRTINVTNDNYTDGTEYFTLSLDNGQASTTVTINDTSKAVLSINQSGSTSGTQNSSFSTSFTTTVNGSQYPAQWSYSGAIPPGTSFTQSGNTFGSFYQVYTLSGTPTSSGTYPFTVYATASTGDSISQSFSLTISPPAYPAAGTTNGGQYCSGYTLYQNYNDGSGGVYASVVAYNSSSCGYVTPYYSLGNTWTSLANNSSGTFYVTSNGNASGVTLTPSISGAGASRVSVSPTSSTISSNGTVNTYFTITSTLPTSTVAAQSVTVSVAGTSFTFTVQAFTVSTIPLVNSIWYADGPDCYSGDSVTAYIDFNGPITASTYVRVQVAAGVYGTGDNVFQAGASYSNASFPIGATSGYYISNANPGIQNVTARINARTENSAGTIQQAYFTGPIVTLWKTGTIPR